MLLRSPTLTIAVFFFLNAITAEANTASHRFKFTIGQQGAVNKNCLFLQVNTATEWIHLGCNDEGVTTKEIPLSVFSDAPNEFRLRLRSAPSRGMGQNVFDSSDTRYKAGSDYRVNRKTPNSIDLWINDNGDNDYRDFRAILEAPKGITFVVEQLLAYDYAPDEVIEDCKKLGTGSEACHWSYYFSDSCLANKCSKLLIYFAGGQMTCPNPENSPLSYLARYADDGYVAVCARIHENQPASGLFPFSKESARVDKLVRTITSDPAITKAWNGERLLFSGVSHGASAAVVAMARNDFDESQPEWRGARVTGACFFDGVYDAKDSLLRVYGDGAANACSIYPRAYGRYCPRVIPIGNYDPRSWRPPSTCQTADMARDTVVGVPANQFAIKHWKLVECGSSLDYCSQDMLAAPPQMELCNRLEADAAHLCSFGSFPLVSHDNCGATVRTMDSCKDWFDGL